MHISPSDTLKYANNNSWGVNHDNTRQTDILSVLCLDCVVGIEEQLFVAATQNSTSIQIHSFAE